MITMHKLFMHRWVGSFRLIGAAIVLALFAYLSPARGQDLERAPNLISIKGWSEVRESIRKKDSENYKKGLSYIISGSSALVAGLLGERASVDPVDKAIYSTFQAIGIASVGYGAYRWNVEDEEKLFYNSLEASGSLGPQEKLIVMESYHRQRKIRESRERVIKAVTHGMVAALNLYGASVQSNENIRSGLYFLAGVNVLAAVSFTF